MARTYAELINLVRRWSNRDIEVLPDAIISDCIRYAADKSYRKLRIAPLEHTVRYRMEELVAATRSSNNRFASVTELYIPDDLIEFIQIRGTDIENRTTRMFNEKADIRTFNDLYAEKYNDFAFWSRQGNSLLLSPGFGNSGTNFGSTGTLQESGVELYYYRRLPALHAVYDVSFANLEDGLLFDMGTTDTAMVGDVTFETFDGSLYTGKPVPNWLRDENERVVLMGALAELFFYLQENEEAQKYQQLFMQEIDELNMEDQMRAASGGNVQINFNGRGLI